MAETGAAAENCRPQPIETPPDKLFGSWHDGSPESLAARKTRIRRRRRRDAGP